MRMPILYNRNFFNEMTQPTDVII